MILLFLAVVAAAAFLLIKFRPESKIQTVGTPVTPDQKNAPLGKPPQYVLLSFDGSKSLPMWRDTLSFAREMNTSGKPLHFTYFISGVYFLTGKTASVYRPPGARIGSSQIGFSDTTDDIVIRIKEINTAIADGHEIGSHANGHFRGGVWTAAQWQQELTQFRSLIFNWKENNGLVGKTDVELHLAPSDVVSFRAPLLSRNPNLYKTLPMAGYAVDSSGVRDQFSEWPTKNAYGIWHVDMGNVPVAGSNSRIITMDYNFFSRETGAKDGTPRASSTWDHYREEVLSTYQNYFTKNYETTRAPVVIGNHFSTWNNGVYWEALKDFAREVCGKPEVRCTTFKEFTSFLNSLPTSASQK